MRSAFSATASGRVQLVMFRDFVQRTASGFRILKSKEPAVFAAGNMRAQVDKVRESSGGTESI